MSISSDFLLVILWNVSWLKLTRGSIKLIKLPLATGLCQLFSQLAYAISESISLLRVGKFTLRVTQCHLRQRQIQLEMEGKAQRVAARPQC